MFFKDDFDEIQRTNYREPQKDEIIGQYLKLSRHEIDINYRYPGIFH